MPSPNTQPRREFNYADGVTLKEYIEARLVAMDKASELAREVNTIQHESLNNWRQAMQEQSKTLMPRAEYEIYHRKVEEDIRMLQKYQATMEGKASQNSVNLALAISIIGTIMAFIGLVEKLLIK